MLQRRRLVTASEDGTTRLADAQTGKEIAVLRASQGAAPARARDQVNGPVLQALFSPDGRRVLTVASDPHACLVLQLAGRQHPAKLQNPLQREPGALLGGDLCA